MTNGEALKKVNDWLKAQDPQDPPLTADMMAAIKRVHEIAKGDRKL